MKKYHLRNKDKAIIDTNELAKILSDAKYVTLAMCNQNEPYLAVLSHGFDKKNRCLYFHCAPEGKKIDFLKVNPLIWGIAIKDDGYARKKCNHYYRSVMFKGYVKLLETNDEKRNAFKTMVDTLEDADPEMKKKIETTDKLGKVAVFRVKIEYWSGKRNELGK